MLYKCLQVLSIPSLDNLTQKQIVVSQWGVVHLKMFPLYFQYLCKHDSNITVYIFNCSRYSCQQPTLDKNLCLQRLQLNR